MAQWSIPLNEFFDEAITSIEFEAKAQFKEGVRFLVDITPRRTGRLRGGYSAGLNSIPNFRRPPDDFDGSLTVSLMHAVIDQWKIDDTLWVVNYTPYGPFVNDGTDRQAGQFMIERMLAHIEQG